MVHNYLKSDQKDDCTEEHDNDEDYSKNDYNKKDDCEEDCSEEDDREDDCREEHENNEDCSEDDSSKEDDNEEYGINEDGSEEGDNIYDEDDDNEEDDREDNTEDDNDEAYRDDTKIEEDDEDEQHEYFEGSEGKEKKIKRTYYPSQICLANEIVDRIKGIYEHYHNYVGLTRFKYFDFYIYTANYNMLQDQTWLRLSKEEYGCFPHIYYEGSDKQTRDKARKKVFKYNTKSVNVHHTQAINEVKNNPETLFLMVADEAHWGATGKEKPQYELINTWNTDEHPNVIVLQVTATPYNLLTKNSRIPTNIFYKKENGQFSFEERIEYSLPTDGFKQLHRVKWTESFEKKVGNGIVVKLKIPLRLDIENKKDQKIGEAQLYVKQPGRNEDFLSWCGQSLTRDCPVYTNDFLIRSVESHITVSTYDNKWTLIVRENDVGFVRESKKSDNYKFRMLNHYGEDIFLLMPVGKRNTHLVYNTNWNKIELSSSRATLPTDEFPVPELKSSFLILESRPVNNLGPADEYISLNYYFNSMRSDKDTDKLIREDDVFENMVEDITGKNISEEIERDDILAAEYSYYIILINIMRRFPLKYETVKECLDNFEECSNHIHDKRSEYIAKFKEKLQNSHSDIKPIHVETFENVLRFLSEKVKKDFEKDKKSITNTKGMKEGSANELIYSLMSCLLHLDVEENKKIGENLKKLEEQKLSQLYSYAKDLQIEDVIKDIIQGSETGNIVDNLIPILHDIRKLNGTMNIIRANTIELGNKKYKTLCIARKESSEVHYSFEILRDHGKVSLANDYRDEAPNSNERKRRYRMRRRLQTKRCQYIDKQTSSSCDCIYAENENIILTEQDMKCQKCKHEHKKVEYYEDLDGLPCILILINKGRLGDTFPQSLKTLDSRPKQKEQLCIASLVQEMGRLCRYQVKSHRNSLPCALISRTLGVKLREALNIGAPYYSAIDLPNGSVRPDSKSRLTRRNASKREGVSDVNKHETVTREHRANKNHSDYENTQKHNNRILLSAEPQIGKTGVYLRVISLLQAHFSSNFPEDSEDEFDDDDESEEEDDLTNTNENQTQLEEKYYKGKWIYPFWKDIYGKPGIKKEMTNGKYIRIYGKYQHNKNAPEMQLCSLYSHGSKIKKTNKTVSQVYPFKSFNYNGHSSCTDCCFQYESIIADICMPKVTDGTEEQMHFTVSVPKTVQYHTLLKHIEPYTENEINYLEPAAGIQGETLKTWIFIPSYNRSRKANVNFYHTMVRENNENVVFLRYTAVLVVRKSEFESYCKLWNSTHAILQIPDKLPGAERDAYSGGIGFARLAIQRFAENLKLNWIFMLDDNIPYVFEVEETDTSVKRTNGCLEERNVSLFKVLKHMETQVDGSVANAPESCYEKYSEKLGPINDPLEDYTGISEKYGIIGLKKYRPTSSKVQIPFKKTHIHSFVLLNIKMLKEKNVSYKAWQVYEDLHLNNDCDDSGLWVVKYNRFTARKTHMKTWIPHVYTWNEETVLSKVENAENSKNIFCYLKSVCPIQSVIRLPKATQRLRDDVVEKFLSNVVQKGKHTMVALDSEEFEKATEELKDIFEDKNLHKGYNDFVIVISSKLCFNKNMRKKKDIEHWLEKILQNFEFEVITSHNVIFFAVEIILITVTVQPLDATNERSSLSRCPSDENEAPTDVLKGAKKGTTQADLDQLEIDDPLPVVTTDPRPGPHITHGSSSVDEGKAKGTGKRKIHEAVADTKPGDSWILETTSIGKGVKKRKLQDPVEVDHAKPGPSGLISKGSTAVDSDSDTSLHHFPVMSSRSDNYRTPGKERASLSYKRMRKSYEDGKKYLETWEDEFTWLAMFMSGGSRQAHAKPLQYHRGTSVNHEQGVQNMKIARSVNTKFVKKRKTNDELRKAELKLALAVCCYRPFLEIDHLQEIMKKHCKGNTLQNIRSHRTNCTSLLRSVLSPSIKSALQSDMRGKKFSLMVDETLDIPKILVVFVRYFSEYSEKIETAFLGLYQVERATGEIFQKIKESLIEYGLSLSDCVGLGSDGAVVMEGENNNVWSRVKTEFPNCKLIKCVYHSLQLCVLKAFEKLPRSLSFLLTEIPNWFSNSTLRRDSYKNLFQELGNENELVNVPFLKISGTRWLGRGQVINILLQNWNELKAYFKDAIQEELQEVGYKAELIYNMLCNDIVYLYLTFLYPYILECEKINDIFQGVNPDPEQMFWELDIRCKDLRSKISNCYGEKPNLLKTDFGADLTKELNRCCKKHESDNKFDDELRAWRENCQMFLTNLIKEVEKRLLANFDIFQGIQGLHPKKVLSKTERYPFSQLPFPHLLSDNTSDTEEQYRKICLQEWHEQTVSEDDPQTFWAKIYKYQDATGAYPYRELASYALSCLSCPVSNADVECIFSIVTCVQNKYRHQISTEVLDSIVRIRSHLMMRNICCTKFEITSDMLERLKSVS